MGLVANRSGASISPPSGAATGRTLILFSALFLATLFFLSEVATVSIIYLVLSNVLTLAAWLLAAWGVGQATTRYLAPEAGHTVHTVAGLGLLWLALGIVGDIGLATPLMAWGLCAVGILAGGVVHRQTLLGLIKNQQNLQTNINLTHWLPSHLAWLWLAAPLATMIVAACCPPGTLWAVEAWGYDVLSYHLQIPREWLAAGQIQGLTHNVYSYFPSLVETGFLGLGLMRGEVFNAVYACQLLNVALVVMTAIMLAQLVQRLAPSSWSKPCGILAFSLYMATPWVLITGSMAYDEAMMLALTTAALSLSLPTSSDPPTHRPWGHAVLVGLLLGLATLAKLTAGIMVVVPIGLLWLLKLAAPTQQATYRKTIGLTACLGLVGLLTLAPYLVRNAIWTGGNPVFPFAAQTLGQGHWNADLVHRFNQGHHVQEPLGERLTALGQHWLFNTGYGAIGGRPRSTNPNSVEARNVAYFPRQWGVPTLLLAGLAGGVLMGVLPRYRQRRLAVALEVVLGVQVVGWLFLTHLQSRFLVFTIPPVIILSALGWALLADRWFLVRRFVPIALATLLVACPTLTGIGLIRQQTIGKLPLPLIIDGLPSQAQLTDPTRPLQNIAGESPINKLPAQSKTLIVADNSRLFYLRRPILYHSAFDASPLGQLIRQHPNNPQATTAALLSMGITHVWVHGPELTRLMNTYGYDPDVTPATLQQLIATGWHAIYDSATEQQPSLRADATLPPLSDRVVLYALPVSR